MPSVLPLSALLSQVLVAFTIEFDNEFEHRTPHRTTRHGSTGGPFQGPWLASMVMWWNCMRFVTGEGVRVRELEDLAGTPTNLNGMERWGYVVVAPDPADSRKKPPHSDWRIRATPKGQEAREVWRPLTGVIEARWEARFGKSQISRLRNSLQRVTDALPFELPDCLPILGYGLFCKGRVQVRPRPDGSRSSPESPLVLPALLSRVLLAWILDFEQESDVSLAIGANLLRVLDEQGVRVRDLPQRTGVSKESIQMALGILGKKRLAVVEPDAAGTRTKMARLTAKGREAQAGYGRLLGAIEQHWMTRFGEDAIQAQREALESLAVEPPEPYPDGWRASVPKPETLPHCPMVLHRGGYPDGS